MKIERVEAELEKVKTELAFKSFRFASNKKDERKTLTNEVDECIVTANCQGNCDHITCRLQTMKLQGGKRTSPGSEAEVRIAHNCPQCNFKSAIKSDVERHVQTEHGSHPNCPFCQIGFYNLSALKHHIDTMHKEPLPSNPRTSVVTRNNINTRNSEKTCVFYFQPRGCKKGTNCDFSHDSSRRQPSIA